MTDIVARPRLLVLATTYPRWRDDHEPGFVHELARRLTGRFDVVVIAPHAQGAQTRENLDGVCVVRYRYAPLRWETLVQDGGITTHLKRSPWKWSLVPTFFAMQWWCARRFVTPYTVVHAHWIILPGIVARLLGRRYLVTSHGADLFALRGRLAARIKRWVLAGATATTVVSRAMLAPAGELRSDLLPCVAPMGVDLTSRFIPDPSVTRESNHLLFVGRLVEKKGVDVLLAAMPAVLSKRPGTILSIVGHGPLAASLQEMAARLGIADVVRFVGPVPSAALPAWYRRASLFVAPFRQARSGDQEGLGLVLVEALGCGCPVITTDIDAVSDVLEAMPGMGRVASDDASALAEGILSMLDDERLAAAVDDGLALLRGRFDWDQVALHYGDMLEAVRTETVQSLR